MKHLSTATGIGAACLILNTILRALLNQELNKYPHWNYIAFISSFKKNLLRDIENRPPPPPQK